MPTHPMEPMWALCADLMFVLDDESRVLAANPAWETITGWPPEQLLGRTPAEFGHQDDVAVIDATRSRIRAGERLTGLRTRFRTPDGSYRWIMWTATRDPSSDLIYAIGKDVTEQRNAELRSARLAAVVQGSDDAIVGKSLDLRITDWNHGAERLYGYEPQEVVGQKFSMLIPADRDGEDRLILERVLAGETVSHFETVRQHKDGHRVDVSVTVSAIHDADGTIIGASSIARDIGVARALARAQEEVVSRLLLAAEFRDHAGGQHGRRMGELCSWLVQQLGWPLEPALLQVAGQMHDIGKIAIPDAILLKPGPLTVHEREIMQTHTTTGHSMLSGSGIPVLDLAAEIALAHHERYDGDGYPNGLAGEAIPISARIAAVADVYDALTSDRVYRRAFTPDQARAMMRAASGAQFDPVVLDALFALGEPGGSPLGPLHRVQDA